MDPAGRIDVVRRRGHGRRLAVAATAAVAVAAAVVAVLTLAQPPHAPGAHAAGTGHRTAGQAALARPWHTYHDPSGFAIGLPPGWAAATTSTTQEKVQFTGTPRGFVLNVEWSTRPQADALADWQQQAAVKAAADSSYRQISISQVSYRSYDAADWEFTNIYQGVLVHVIDRTFIVRPGQLAYAIALSGPAGQWSKVYASIWPRLMTSFQPAS
jgi:hypothetical protein